MYNVVQSRIFPLLVGRAEEGQRIPAAIQKSPSLDSLYNHLIVQSVQIGGGIERFLQDPKTLSLARDMQIYC